MQDKYKHEEVGKDLEVARILYKEIVEGDRRKIEAKSNDADTGGGARDFRFGAFKQLLPVVANMFPEPIAEKRKRDGAVADTQVLRGQFFWQNEVDGPVQQKASFFETPTDVRPSEGRIARVHEYPCFNLDRIPKPTFDNRVLLLLVQRHDGSVWPHFVEERSLRTPREWDEAVAAQILQCLDARRQEGRAVIGFKDFISGASYCNGK
jgi:hypothetical protein